MKRWRPVIRDSEKLAARLSIRVSAMAACGGAGFFPIPNPESPLPAGGAAAGSGHRIANPFS